jgi:hypothetical protein
MLKPSVSRASKRFMQTSINADVAKPELTIVPMGSADEYRIAQVCALLVHAFRDLSPTWPRYRAARFQDQDVFGLVMKRFTKQLAFCLENTGNEPSLIVGKVYPVLPDARAATDALIRVIDESGDDYLFARRQSALVDCERSPQASRPSKGWLTHNSARRGHGLDANLICTLQNGDMNHWLRAGSNAR